MNLDFKQTIRIAGEKQTAQDVPQLSICMDQSQGEIHDAVEIHITATNQCEKSLGVETIELGLCADWFLSDTLSAYQVYKEGLTVVGVSGARQAGDCDFELDPTYLPLTVSDPEHYSWKRENHFCAEQVAVIRNTHTGEVLLAGFTTSRTCFCRILLHPNSSTGLTVTLVFDLDTYRFAPGETLQLETLLFLKGKDAEPLLAHYAQNFGGNMGVNVPPKSLSGWCSYYYYYGQETESDILENAQFLATHRDTIPVDYIQIDDGWQKARGDWLEHHPDKFPNGMKWLAQQINALGFKPGIWVAPFLVAPSSPVYKNHADWLLRDRQGNLLDMGGNYFLDPTHPNALDWVRHVFTTIKSWGYSYFKLDFMMVTTHFEATYYTPNCTRVQAYRKGLQAIRESVGSDSFLLGGTCLIAPSVGVVDGSRISTDVTPFWAIQGNTPESPTIFNVCRNIINRGYMHGRLWINDPDCLIVREKHNREKYKDVPSLTLDETHMLASAMILSGASIFLGDRMQDLPENRLRILQTVLKMNQGAPAYPVDRMDTALPSIWFRRGSGRGDQSSLLALFNWDDCEKNIPLPLNTPGLEHIPESEMINVWEGKSVDLSGKTDWTLKPHTCILLAF